LVVTVAEPGEVRVVEKEVIVERVLEVVPAQHLHQKKALEDYNESVVQQRDRLGEELLAREAAVQRAQLQRLALESKLADLQAKLMGGVAGAPAKNLGGRGRAGLGPGATPAEQAEMEQALKERERRRSAAKVRAKKRKEASAEAERLAAEAVRKEAEEELSNAKEEAESAERQQRHRRRRLEKKLDNARGEVEDLTAEFQLERNGLLESIRAQNRELKLLEQVLSTMLPAKEITKVRANALG
jgi:kinesin family protein 3/17